MLIVFSNMKISVKEVSQITNFIVYELEHFTTDRAVPYCFSLYRISNLASENNPDLTNGEYRRSRKETNFFSMELIVSLKP